VVLYKGFTDPAMDSEEIKALANLGFIAGLQEEGIPTFLLISPLDGEDEGWKQDLEDVATAKTDRIPVTSGEVMMGLERFVVMCLSDKLSPDRVAEWTRCTTQLINVTVPVDSTTALHVHGTSTDSLSYSLQYVATVFRESLDTLKTIYPIDEDEVKDFFENLNRLRENPGLINLNEVYQMWVRSMGPEIPRIIYKEDFGTDTFTEKLTELNLKVAKNIFMILFMEEECDDPQLQTKMHDFLGYGMKAFTDHFTRERGCGQLLQAITKENAKGKSNNPNGKTETDTVQKELEEASLTQQHSSIQSGDMLIIKDNNEKNESGN
jgi:hypothetical protein